MGKRYPEGTMGELVGLNDGWTSAKTRLVRIVGGSQTTVAVDDGGKRRTFNRSNWYERGSKGNYRPHLVSETMARFDLAAQAEKQAKRGLLGGLRNRLDTIEEYARNDGSLSMENLDDLLKELRELTAYVEETTPIVRHKTSETNELRKELWG